MDDNEHQCVNDGLLLGKSSEIREIEPPSDIASTSDESKKYEYPGPFRALPSKAYRLSLFKLTWEISSLCLATASLIGLVVLLLEHQAKPSPEWSLGSYGVTLNAIISILSTVFRASILVPVATSISQFGWIWLTLQPRPLQDICYYDSATRGPLGCFRLLYRLRFLHFASIGAFVTIVALALDPVFQQLVRYNTQSAVDVSLQAHALAAYTYDPGVGLVESSDDIPNTYVRIPYNMKVAMYQGVLSSSTVSPVYPPFNCPSGNCTWDPFGTLSVRTQCTDITSEVTLNCTQTDTTPYCNFVATQDTVLSSMLNETDLWSVLVMQAADGRSFVPALEPYANPGFLAGVQWVKAIDNFGTVNGYQYIQQDTKFEAMRCYFSLSILEIKASVVNGIYSEVIQQEYTQPESTSILPTWKVNNTDYHFIDPEQMWEAPDQSLIYAPPFAKAPPNRDNGTFSILYPYMLLFISQLSVQNFLTGTVSFDATAGLKGPEIPSMLLKSDNVTRAMYTLADYITTSLRANDSIILQEQRQNATLIAPEQAIVGTVLVQRQFVTVQWGWIVIPIVLLLLTIAILVVAYVKTQTSGIGFWQTSPLTLFFHGRSNGFPPDFGGKAAVLGTADAMRDAAAAYTAQIERNDEVSIEIWSQAEQEEFDNTKLRLRRT